MQIIDISRPLPCAPKYPAAPETTITQISFIAKGAESNFTVLNTNTHAGTHVDAKKHFVGGAQGIGEMDLSIYYGSVRVITFPENAMLSRSDFEGRIDGVSRVAIHGGGNTFLLPSAAEYLVEAGIRCIVTDGMSPAPLDNEKQIHYCLLDNDVGIVENVVFSDVADGDYTLVAFPANFGSLDGAPARVVLLRED